MSNAELSPDARALWFVLKFHATEPTAAESGIITFLMGSGGTAGADASEISNKSGIAEGKRKSYLHSLSGLYECSINATTLY